MMRKDGRLVLVRPDRDGTRNHEPHPDGERVIPASEHRRDAARLAHMLRMLS